MTGVQTPHVNGANGVNGTVPERTVAPGVQFDNIDDTIEAFARGEFILVLDSASRENEGDLIIAASDLTPAKCAFMIRHTSGYLCAPLTPARCLALDLPAMIPLANSTDPHRTAYTITVDAADGTTTGISAADRARTSNLLADPNAVPTSFRRPGHVVPLCAREGLIRERQGHTEAAVEFCRLAGKHMAAVIGEMVTDGEADKDGRPEYVGVDMMRRDGCLEFGRKWGIRVCTIEDLVEYVEAKEGKIVGNKKRG
ncbi:3,4-dihydroxy-2-butanone 4-phosphate synthase [Eremomyces bilateralis CBS 781.70]|uniref:3,4-dihydroxy-2-butanone 4-phosphate synthase n=1 Tax=Eremomyces bilateralis CBS 781.70 TaxID=1392243 RepID=A0A6G1G6Q7_9PEZI|nr:3,4-dihydroxy-2-butanone 4-phosphate synthase [Eremomyces bilateralis CBS 781.70]KAF1813570.1 3,4-dihydroxy-2-butanone 4-phosphate synthase [Eremomyces bilateralis CBS 781.70]